jgi:ADYC domain
MKMWSRVALLAISSTVPACQPEVEVTAAELPLGGRFEEGCDDESGVSCYGSIQSRRLQGTTASRLEGLSVSASSAFWIPAGGPPIQSVSADAAGLAVFSGGTRLSDAQLVGLTMTGVYGTGTIAFRIRGGTGGRYSVETRGNDGAWRGLCDPGALAYVVKGDFSSVGILGTDDPDRLSFACEGGAAAKAIAWGYGPWNGLGDYFLAATRVARADYCGLGDTHTLDGTRVLIYNLDGVGLDEDDPPSPPAGEPAYFFEAAWSPDRDEGALCLAKRRWNVLPPGGFCPDRVPDPRIDPRGVMCDELGDFEGATFVESLALLADAGATAFSSSQKNDAALWVWRAGSTRHLTTTRGFWGGLAGGTEVPEAGFEVAYGAASYVAAVHTVDRGDATVPLYEYRHGANGEFRTTTAVLGAPWQVIGVTGYVYSSAAAVPAGLQPVELRTWIRPGTGTPRYLLLSSANPAPGWSSGYVAGEVEGYGFVME